MLSVRTLLPFNASGGHEQYDTLKDEGQVVKKYLLLVERSKNILSDLFAIGKIIPRHQVHIATSKSHLFYQPRTTMR
jgi:hypothetical protein